MLWNNIIELQFHGLLVKYPYKPFPLITEYYSNGLKGYKR